MSDNDYVATAAAEKRLREVLDDRLPGGFHVEDIAVALLAGAKIEYKPRTKQVLISLDLPDKATASKAIVEPSEAVTAPEGTPVAGEQETTQAAPIPRLAPFAPKIDPDAEYEDIHFD